jgi:hypothetical protein
MLIRICIVLLLGCCTVAQAQMDAAAKKAQMLKMKATKQAPTQQKPAKPTPQDQANAKLKALDKMKAAQSAMPNESQLAAEPMPEDVYGGSDKAELLSLAESKWNAAHPDKKVLAKGISMRKWDRKTVWRKESLDPTKKYKVDFSEIQAWVITKTDERVATKYIVEISKDHTKGDALKVYVPEDLNSSGIFKTHMLLENVKP